MMKKTLLISVSIGLEVEVEEEKDFSSAYLDVKVTSSDSNVVKILDTPNNCRIVDSFIVQEIN